MEATEKKRKQRPDKVYDGRNPHKCVSCGFRVRGDNHNEGPHHTMGKDGKCNNGSR
jgi:hypothetical protein